MVRVAFFGGTFDPIHQGHIHVIQQALKKLPISYIIVVPAWLNPHKKSVYASGEQRLHWVKEATQKISRKIIVSSYEIDQNRPVRTIETIRALKQKYGKITLIIGSDTVKKFHTWFEYRHLRREVDVVVATRKGFKVPRPYKTLNVRYDMSSTRVRRGVNRRFLPLCISLDIQKFYKGKR